MGEGSAVADSVAFYLAGVDAQRVEEAHETVGFFVASNKGVTASAGELGAVAVDARQAEQPTYSHGGDDAPQRAEEDDGTREAQLFAQQRIEHEQAHRTYRHALYDASVSHGLVVSACKP